MLAGVHAAMLGDQVDVFHDHQRRRPRAIDTALTMNCNRRCRAVRGRRDSEVSLRWR